MAALPDITGRVVAHMDCDAFFYSVECRRDPSLVGKAVIVAGDSPRAVVTTASYEARKYGVGSAMPAARAMRLCPHAIRVPPHGDLYRATSQQIWEIIRRHLSTDLQHVSLDEAYAELTGLHEDPVAVLKAAIAEVKEATGITVSVGLGPSRLVAKCCSDWDKPAGFTVMSREQAAERFAPKSTRTLPGIGPRTDERLLSLGIATIAHLQAAGELTLTEAFGARYASELKARAFFYDDSPVVTERVAKSKSVEHTFDTDIADLRQMEQVLIDIAAKLSDQVKARKRRGKTIGIKVRLDDFTTVTRDRTLPDFTDDGDIIATVAVELLREYDPPRPVRLLGVRVSSFEDLAAAPASDAGADEPQRPPTPRKRPAYEQLQLPVVF